MILYTSCGITGLPEDLAMVTHEVPLGKNNLGGLIWMSSEVIVTGRADLDKRYENTEPWILRPDGNEFRAMKLPDVEGCRKTFYVPQSRLSDGRIGFSRVCRAPFDAHWDTKTQIVAVHPETSEVEVLSDLEDKLFPLEVSWNPTLTRAIASQGSGICASLSWIIRDGVEDLPLTMGEGKKSWRLDEELHADTCTGGRAGSPAWSPDGKHIAFFASPDSFGVKSHARVDKPWNLYLMNPETLELKTLVKGVQRAGGTAWSPDSRWIAYTGHGGIFVVPAAGGNPQRLSSLDGFSLSWSPQGNEIAFLTADDSAPEKTFQTKMLIMDISKLSK